MDFKLTKEQQDIVRAARKFAKGEFCDRAMEFDRKETFDLAIWKKACELGFVGVFIDEEYDGAGYGFFEHCLINEEFWAVEPGMAAQILSTTFGAELILLHGTEKQKQTWLPRLVAGEAIMGVLLAVVLYLKWNWGLVLWGHTAKEVISIVLLGLLAFYLYKRAR